MGALYLGRSFCVQNMAKFDQFANDFKLPKLVVLYGHQTSAEREVIGSRPGVTFWC